MMIWEKAVLGNFHICVLMVSDCSICRPKSQQLAGKGGTLVWSGLTIGTWCTHHDYNSPWLKMSCLYFFMGKFTIWGWEYVETPSANPCESNTGITQHRNNLQ